MVALIARNVAPAMMVENVGIKKHVDAVIQYLQEWQLLSTILMAVDNKDCYTRHHSEEVLFYAILIAQQLGLSDSEQEQLYTAALLHDIGKIGVSDAILKAPRALSPDEMFLMRQHPILGASMVSLLQGPSAIVDAIRHHHESWNGAGYPDGLIGDTIPEMARILAVADTYSALIHDRPYRKGVSPCEALAVLEAGAGQQWDPICVTALLRACHRPGFH